MGTWHPATFEEVECLLDEEIAELPPAHRARFETMRVPFRKVPVGTHPGATVIVVAEHDAKILYYSDIEEGWEITAPTTSGGISERGGSQFELTHIMWRLFGDPEQLG